MRVLLVIAIVGIWLIVVLLSHAYSTRNKTTKLTQQEIILACEKLSAVASNEGWSYKSCIENLSDEKPRELTI